MILICFSILNASNAIGTCSKETSSTNCSCSGFEFSSETNKLFINCSAPVKNLMFLNSSITYFNASSLRSLGLQLEFVTLDDLGIKYVDLYSYSGRGMKNISLNNNLLQEVPKMNLPNLEVLHLESNKIVEVSSVTKVGRLKELYLSFNRIYSLSYRSFSSLRYLKTLKLNNNLITEISKAVFKKNYDLDDIDLRSNQIIYMDPEFYKSLPENFDLRISNNVCPAVNMKFTVPAEETEMPVKIIDIDYVIKVRTGNTTKLLKDLKGCFSYTVNGYDQTLNKEILESLKAVTNKY